MKKIIYVVPSLKDTGPTKQLSLMIKNLKSFFDITLFVLNKGSENTKMDLFKSFNIKIFEFERNLALSSQVEFLEAFCILEKINIIHSQGIRADRLVSKIKIEIKKITTLRNIFFIDYPQKFGLFKGFAMSILNLFYVSRFDVIVTCSFSIYNFYKTIINKNKLIAIQNGISVNQSSEIFQKNINLNNKNFLYVGSLIKRKNIDKMIKFFLALPLKNKKLTLVGDGPLRLKTTKKYINQSNIIFKGFKTNVNNFYQDSNYFISLSKSEGLPNALLEGLLNNLPCIVSNIGPHKEVLEVFPEKSYFIYNGNSSKEIKRFHDFLNYNENNTFNLRSIVEKNFSDVLMSKKYSDLYEK